AEPDRSTPRGPKRANQARRKRHRSTRSRTEDCRRTTRTTAPLQAYSPSISRFSHAQAATSTRLRSPRRDWIEDRWLLTVLREMNNWSATSWLVRPRATARTTSVSRADSGLGRALADVPAGEVAQEPQGDRRRNQGVPRMRGTHGLHEQLGPRVLEDETHGPASERPVDVLVQVERGHHDHPQRVGHPRARQGTSDLQTVQARHAYVHQAHVRSLPPRQLH